MMWSAMIFTVLAWIAGLVADALIPFQPFGYLMLRVLLPLLVMGGFILSGRNKNN